MILLIFGEKLTNLHFYTQLKNQNISKSWSQRNVISILLQKRMPVRIPLFFTFANVKSSYS